jgi:hypothetical protein
VAYNSLSVEPDTAARFRRLRHKVSGETGTNVTVTELLDELLILGESNAGLARLVNVFSPQSEEETSG